MRAKWRKYQIDELKQRIYHLKAHYKPELQALSLRELDGEAKSSKSLSYWARHFKTLSQALRLKQKYDIHRSYTDVLDPLDKKQVRVFNQFMKIDEIVAI